MGKHSIYPIKRRNHPCWVRRRKIYLISFPSCSLWNGQQWIGIKALFKMKESVKRRRIEREKRLGKSKLKKYRREYYKNNKIKFQEKARKYYKEKSKGFELKQVVKSLDEVIADEKENKIKYDERKRKLLREQYWRDPKRHREYGEKYRRNSPDRLINKTVAEFRSDKIGLDEFNRRIDKAIKRSNDFYNRNSKARRKPI